MLYLSLFKIDGIVFLTVLFHFYLAQGYHLSLYTKSGLQYPSCRT